jgi:hypothetical protein
MSPLRSKGFVLACSNTSDSSIWAVRMPTFPGPCELKSESSSYMRIGLTPIPLKEHVLTWNTVVAWEVQHFSVENYCTFQDFMLKTKIFQNILKDFLFPFTNFFLWLELFFPEISVINIISVPRLLRCGISIFKDQIIFRMDCCHFGCITKFLKKNTGPLHFELHYENQVYKSGDFYCFFLTSSYW